MGPVKPHHGDTLPITTPARSELWRRHQLALSVLDQRGHSAETAALVRRILAGEAIESLFPRPKGVN